MEENRSASYLLSNDLEIMAGLDLEGTIIRPEIHRVCDTCHSSLIDLTQSARYRGPSTTSYQLCSLRTSDGELQVGIFLPITKEKGEFGKEAVVDISSGSNGLRIRVAIETTFKGFRCSYKPFPELEIIWIFNLPWSVSASL